MLTTEQIFESQVWRDLNEHYNRFDKVLQLSGAYGWIDKMPEPIVRHLKDMLTKQLSVGDADLGSFSMGFLCGLITTLPAVQDSLETWMNSGFQGNVPTQVLYYAGIRKVFLSWYDERLEEQAA